MEELEALEQMWDADSKINETNLVAESSNTPKLHSKYFKLLTRNHLKVMKLRSDLKILELNKSEYYSGNMAKEDLDALGWKPYQKKIIRSDLTSYIEADPDYISLSLRLGLFVAIETKLEDIIRQINQRNYQIKNMIDFLKFTNGMN